jgi:cell wall-associated NlpC family hydrolase
MTLITVQDVHGTIAEALAERGLDHRTCYTRVRAAPPGGALVVECSERSVLDDLARRFAADHGHEASGIGLVLLPEEGVGLPELFIATGSVVDVRRENAHTSELVSQAVCGDSMAPLKRDGDWCLVRLDDGYIGWVRSWHLKGVSRAEFERFRSSALHRVTSTILPVFERPDELSQPIGDAVVGTPITVSPCEKRGWKGVTLPDGRKGFVRSRGIGRRPARPRVARDAMAATGLRFIGIPYLWGGTTPRGFDCSGLVQRIYRLHGVSLPRDSDQQARRGRLKPAGSYETLRTGDLLFFGKSDAQITHVGMYLADGLFLHAYGHVRVGSLDPRHALYEATLSADWRCTRDPLAD